ncbi:MAG: ATP-binding protein, partial [Gemmatimonadales bacterium]
MLRGKFGPEAFEADRDHIRLVYPHLDLDLNRLAAGDVLGDEFTPPLEVAGFLEEFEIADGTEFMLWRDRTQARLLPVIREALVKLMDRCRRTGDFRRIEGLADRMLGIDELCEDAIRAKMEARAFDGDRLTALKIFESWKARLEQELGASPSSLLEGIALRLRRRGWERSATPDIPPVRIDHWKGRIFIGRSAEYRAVYEAWEQTRQGAGRHALILGDSGIGKSTLVERLMTAAGLEGAATSRVQCYEVEREIPYAAVGGLVRGLLDRPGVTGTPPEWLAELGRTIAEVRLRFPAIPEPPPSEGETARIRLTEGVHQLLSAIAEESPVIVVVDDVHLADDASVAVLHLVMRRTQSQRIMVLLTARPGELGQSPNAGRLRECQTQLGMQLLDLPPMSDEESTSLLAALVPAGESQPGTTASRAILRAAAGYPMVLELLLRDWQANGERSLALSLGAMRADPGATGAPGDAYRRLVDRLIHDVDPATRNVLNLAAILGGRLNDLSLYELVDLSIGQTMTGMTRLTDLRLLRDSGQALEFRNELIRAQAYWNIPSPLRRTLHEQIADRLLAAEQQGREVPGLEIAWHCIRSGRATEATPYLLRGAREAMQRGAVHEAERGLATALDHLTEPERSEASMLLAEVLQEQGRWEESLKVLTTCQLFLSGADQEIAFVLGSIAEWRVGKVESTCLETKVNTLAHLVRVGATAKTRVKATRVASWIFEDVQDRSGAAIVLDGARSIHVEHLTDQEAGEIAVSKASLAYCTRSGGDYVVAL